CEDRLRTIASPSAVPDVISVDPARHHRAAVIRNSIGSTGSRGLVGLARRGALAPTFAGRNQIFLFARRLDLCGLDGQGTRRDHGRAGKLDSKTMHDSLLEMGRFPTTSPSYRCSDQSGRWSVQASAGNDEGNSRLMQLSWLWTTA